MIQKADRDRLVANFVWFNDFFDGMRQLLERIRGNLRQAGLDLPGDILYYRKYSDYPSLPPFYGMGLGGETMAVQVFAIFDLSMLQRHSATFNHEELSLIVVKHGRADKYGYFEDYGLRVVHKERLRDVAFDGKILSGTILTEQGIPFAAFQVPLACFVAGQDINRHINEHIVDVINDLPSWV